MIIGSRIVEVYSTFEISDGLDVCTYYFTSDRGFIFSMPWADQEWLCESLPDKAKREKDRETITSYDVKKTWWGGERFVRAPDEINDTIWRLKQPTIVGVYWNYERSNSLVLMSDGFRLSYNSVAPHGTGGAGLYYQAPNDELPPISKMTDYFQIPLEKTQQ